jgi:error-prone DNA polymerase
MASSPEPAPAYAELQATSNFSFLRGASHPDELVLAAARQGLAAIAVTDRNSLAGLVRAHKAAQQVDIRLVAGVRLDLRDSLPPCGGGLGRGVATDSAVDAARPHPPPQPSPARGEGGPRRAVGLLRAPPAAEPPAALPESADKLPWPVRRSARDRDPDDAIALSLLAYPTDRAAYGRLTRLLTDGKRRAPKGECHLTLDDVLAAREGLILVVLPPAARDRRGAPPAAFAATLARIAATAQGNIFLAACHRGGGEDDRRLAALAALAAEAGAPLVAVNDVHYHDPSRRRLQDVLTCIRTRCTIDEAGLRLAANAERHVKTPAEMARLFACYPEAIANGLAIVERCRFSLEGLRYEYPEELTREGRTPQQELELLAWEGAARRWPQGVPETVRGTIARELALVGRLGYAPFFLTVHDVVRFAESRGILCQGRGSAANSTVCYCLGITAVDPGRADLLFERFISAARNEPPDIDVDFEHERREEVIQYIYRKYGRHRTGLAATVICYRSRSAIREVGKALGLSLDVVGALAGSVWGWSEEGVAQARVRELGMDPAGGRLALALELSRQLVGFPRHLSQHVGGFVMTRGRLDEMVPIENAAMADRTVIEWDKDDIDALGILKVDVLALGMLTCLAKGFALLRRHYGLAYDTATVPAEDPAVYDMLCRADSIGVFQVESRAQMTMLPRLKPRNYYDLVIEVAIVRPGPIQGDMVHPYLRRRNGKEAVHFPKPELAEVLGKTLGVPLFQEQAMRIAIVAAGFTPDEADQLRRAMATFRHVGTIHSFETKLIEGMVANGYERDFAERCFRQIEGFGTYGFPESHAASFALLVYVSAWMKCHHPAVFACAMLNSQPMGFYAPAQLVRDAREHGVEVRPVDVNYSGWDSTLEPAATGLALRLGLRLVKGLAKADAERLVRGRGNFYAEAAALWRRARLPAAALEALAKADAFGSLGLSRRQALWAVQGLATRPLPLFAAAGEPEQGEEPEVTLPAPTLGEEVSADYASLHLTLKRHPMALLRGRMAGEGRLPAERLAALPDGARVAVAGLTLVRQRPGTASGVIFVTLEDETGVANIVVWPTIFEAFRRTLLSASLMGVTGRLQREGLVIHVVAERLDDLSPLLHDLGHAPADFSAALARADEVRKPGRDAYAVEARALGLAPKEPGFKSRDFR